MTERNKDHTEGATVGEDVSGLLQAHLVNKSDRDEAELEMIALAYNKHVYRSRRKKADAVWFTEEFIRKVHSDMFGTLWEWAGKYRTTETNIGVNWHQIPEQVARLVKDFEFWNSAESKMSVLEIAARLQNRLTRVHPFKNGNGRHARLLTDIFFHSQKHPLPEWPQLQRMPQGDEIRKRYIAAMKKADLEDYDGLIKFIESFMERERAQGS